VTGFFRRMWSLRSGRDVLVMLVAMVAVLAAEFYFLVRDEAWKVLITAAMGMLVGAYTYKRVLPRYDAEVEELFKKKDKEE
jgi:ABC-type thiamin/hydroxymethylpyrimidine transport system permease subunit